MSIKKDLKENKEVEKVNWKRFLIIIFICVLVGSGIVGGIQVISGFENNIFEFLFTILFSATIFVKWGERMSKTLFKGGDMYKLKNAKK